MLKALLITLVLVALAAPAHGTAIIVVRSEGRVILAADSRLTTGGVGCKIHRAGKWHLMIGGIMHTTNPDYDLRADIRRALARTQTLADVEDALDVVYERLRAILTRESAGPGMRRLFAAGDQVVAIVVADVDAVGLLVVTVETVTPVTLRATWSTPDGAFRYGATVAEGPLTAWLHESGAAEAADVTRIFTAQIAATPTEVGGPIDVVELTAAGARWSSDRDSLCAP